MLMQAARSTRGFLPHVKFYEYFFRRGGPASFRYPSLPGACTSPRHPTARSPVRPEPSPGPLSRPSLACAAADSRSSRQVHADRVGGAEEPAGSECGRGSQ